jgi:hypothetical protein
MYEQRNVSKENDCVHFIYSSGIDGLLKCLRPIPVDEASTIALPFHCLVRIDFSSFYALQAPVRVKITAENQIGMLTSSAHGSISSTTADPQHGDPAGSCCSLARF